MSIPTILTDGYGNGTFSTTIKEVVLMGYSIGAVVALTVPAGHVLSVMAEDTRLRIYGEDTTLVVR